MDEYVLMQLSNGLIIGALYALMALGLTVIFSVLKVINFAHGEFYMIGGYMSYWFLTLFAGAHPLMGVLIAMVALFLIGGLFDSIFLRPLHQDRVDRPHEYAILVTFGLAFFLQNLFLAVAGPFPHRPPSFGEGGLSIGFLMISADRLIAAGLSILLMGILVFILWKSWMGRGLRAVSQDQEAASISGLNPMRMKTLAFAIGAALAGASGALVAPIFSIVPDVGVLPAIRSFIIIVLGGMGSVSGAIIGGIVLGVVESLGAAFVPDPSRAFAYKPAYGLLLFMLVLLFRPQGLFGEEQ